MTDCEQSHSGDPSVNAVMSIGAYGKTAKSAGEKDFQLSKGLFPILRNWSILVQ